MTYDNLVQQKMAEGRYYDDLVAYKVALARGDKSVPKPRTAQVDALEVARIRALNTARAVQHRAAQLIQEARGSNAAYITDTLAPSREAYFRKDAEAVEYRDCVIGGE
jgi:hypothetical protein